MGILDRFWHKAPAPDTTPPAPPMPKRVAAHINAVRSFEAALQDRLNASWRAPGQTSNDEIEADLEITRNRARDLSNNNEFAKKYISLCAANVVGASGFGLQSLASEAGKPDGIARTLIEQSFSKWARRGNCEITARLAFADVQRQVIETWARDGEALLIQITGKQAGNAWGYALRMIEVERLPVHYTRELAAGARIAMGVEVDDLGRVQAYWINLGRIDRNNTTSYSQATLTRVPADQVIHVYKPYRAEQLRGMPTMHAVINGLKMLDGYEEAAIVAARIGASKMGFFTTPEGDAAPLADDKDEVGYIQDADPGSFQVLPKGVNFQEWNPDYPHANYADFMKTRLRSIASGLGVTYHGLANDLEGVNFSSIRSGTLEERDAWMLLQNWFTEAFLRPVFSAWLHTALTAGAIAFPSGSKLPISKEEKFAEHTWLGRRWGWVDPLKDIEASRLAIKSGIASPQMVAAQSGVDIEDVIAAIAEFEQQLSASGVTLVDYQTTASMPGAPQASAPASAADPNAADGNAPL